MKITSDQRRQGKFQFWADAMTKNCVWMFQKRYEEYGPEGCTCEYELDEDLEIPDDFKCTCTHKVWKTEAIYLLREEARNHGLVRPYEYGKEKEDWRIYGVPLYGIAPGMLAKEGVNREQVEVWNQEIVNEREQES